MKARIMNRVVEIPDGMVRQDGARGVGKGVIAPFHEAAASQQASDAVSPLPGWPKPTDKWNWSYAQFLELEKQSGRIKWWWYEPFALWLPGEIRYRPDFMIQYPDGLDRKVEFVEVKGWSRSIRAAINRYKTAAALFPCFDWRMVKRERGGWVDY